MTDRDQQPCLDQQTCLKNAIDTVLKGFSEDQKRHKWRAVILKGITVSMAGLITVLLGWKVTSEAVPPILANVALVLGALITVVSAYEAFFDPRSLWIRETIVVSRLRDLQREFAYAAAGAAGAQLDTATLDLFKAKLDAIMDKSLQIWLKLRGVEES